MRIFMVYIFGVIKRSRYVSAVRESIERNPVTAILGPRQCGKTTLARMVGKASDTVYFDLENPEDVLRLAAPMRTLEDLTGLVVIDEIQRQPNLFSLLRVLVDRPECHARYLVLGSAAPDLVKGVSESLAGRVGFVDLAGFDLGEVGADSMKSLWNRGGFPRSFLSVNDKASLAWRMDFIRTFLERDLPQLGIHIPTETLRRFWTMLAHFHGQIWNASELARSMGFSENTIRHYLDLLCGAYMARRLPPWFENLGKRQVKAPKIYLRDSGLLHALLRIENGHALLGHPKLGASWEGFVLEQLAGRFPARDMYYWRTYNGAELDVLLLHNGKKWGFEIKYADAPDLTRSMRMAMSDLKLSRLFIVYPGKKRIVLDKNVEVISINDVAGLELSGDKHEN